jgi:DinB superfamily
MRADLEELRTALTEAIRGMSAEDLCRHPEGKWSAAEILDHLNLTYIGTVKNLERCVQAGHTRASSDRGSKRWQRWGITKLGYFPPGRKSPERVRPRNLPAEQVGAEVIQNLEQMQQVIAECEVLFGDTRPVADHPILGPLTTKEWRRFHLVHGKHHAKQILRLRNS